MVVRPVDSDKQYLTSLPGRGVGDSSRGAPISGPSDTSGADARRLTRGKTVVAAAVIVVALAAAAQPKVGSGNPLAKTWDVTGFDRVQVTSAFRFQITQGSGFKVVTTADDNILPQVEVTKDGSTLRVGMANGQFQTKSPLKVEITLPMLAWLELSGASKGTVTGFRSEKALTLKLAGATNLEGDLGAGSVDVTAEGASTLALAGSAQSAQLSGSGASRLILKEFRLQRGRLELSDAAQAEITTKASADVKLSGASKCTVETNGSLTYELSSASQLEYFGSPTTLTGTKTGASSVSLGRR